MEDEKIRLNDERLATFYFGRLVERSVKGDPDIEDMDLEFRKPTESPDAKLLVRMKTGEEYTLNVEFEGWSSNFKTHRNDSIKSDLIVCMLVDRNDFDVPILDVIAGKTLKPYESTKGSFLEQLRELRKKKSAA